MTGAIIVNKPESWTSHDIVNRIRRLANTRRVGHLGTLDPMATGVLLVLVGQACKLSGYLTSDSKRYDAEITFGCATDTLDAEGRITREAPWTSEQLSRARVEAALAGERDRVGQVPPAVSAIKVDGERSYALAREGNAPELPPRAVRVLELALVELQPPRLSVSLWVSKGYYVRSLARDLGERLGVPAHLSALRRTASGPFTLAQACTWPAEQAPRLLSVAEAAASVLPACRIATAEAVGRARQGKRLLESDFSELPKTSGPGAWLSPEGELVAIGNVEGELKVLRGFNSEPPR